MSIAINDKFILMKQMDRLSSVGSVFEVANIAGDNIVLRDAQTKVAVCSVRIDEIDKYFIKENGRSNWTDWYALADHRGNVVGYYKTNNYKVIAKMNNGVRAMATCNYKHGDEFNLATGIQIAYMRCVNKYLRKSIKEYNCIVNELESEFSCNNDKLNQLISSMSVQ